MDNQTIIAALAFVSWALLGIIFYDLKGQLRENTKAHIDLYTKVLLLIQRFDGTEHNLKDRIESIEDELVLHRGRIHELSNRVATIISKD